MIVGEIYKTKHGHPCTIIAEVISTGTSVFKGKVLCSSTFSYPVGHTFSFVINVFERCHIDLEEDFMTALKYLEDKL